MEEDGIVSSDLLFIDVNSLTQDVGLRALISGLGMAELAARCLDLVVTHDQWRGGDGAVLGAP